MNKILDYSRDYKEPKESAVKFNSSKFEDDLFKEENHVVNKLVRVKRQKNSGGEKWKIFIDNKNVCTIDGNPLKENVKVFLRSVEGLSYVIGEYKKSNLSEEEIVEKILKKIT
jgi:hypothetical protein